MLRKTTFALLLLAFCLFLWSTQFFAQQREAAPYPVLQAKQNFLDAEEYFMNRADFVLAEQLYREVYERLSPKQVLEKAYVGLRLAFTLVNLNKQNEALPLLETIEKTLSGQGKETELLLADLYTYRAKCFAKNIVVDKALEWNDKAMAIKTKYYPEAHPKLGESYAAYTYVHNYFTKNVELTSRYLDLEKAVVTQHPDDYPKYEQVAFHYNMANYCSTQGEYLKASVHGKKAIQLLEPFKQLHPRYLANCYAMMGIVHLRMEDAKPAIQYFEEALSHQVVTRKDSLDRALTYTNIGYAYSLEREMERATGYFKLGMSYYNERDTIYRAYAMNKLAEHYMGYPDVEFQKNILDSIYLYINKSIELFKAKYKEPSHNLVSPYATLGIYYDIIDDTHKSLYYFHLSILNSVPNFNNQNVYSQPLAKDCINGYMTEVILMNKSYASYCLAKKSVDEKSLLHSLSLNNLLDSLHDIKKKFFLDEYSIINHPNIQRNYGLILEILFYANQQHPQQYFIEQFFNNMERVKGNLLLRNLSDIQQSKLYGVPEDLILKSKEIATKINDYLRTHPESIASTYLAIKHSNDTLFQLLQQKDSLEQYFHKNHPQYYQVRFQAPSLNLENIQKKLGEHALLEFYWAENDIFALYLSKGNPQIYRIPIDESLISNIESLIKFLKENSKVDFLNFQKNAYELYAKLLAPIFKGDIPSKLIIVTDGSLAAIPFETLLTSKSNFETINYRDLPYLLHKTAVSYAYSTNTLLQAHNESNLLDSPSLLAFSFSDEKESENSTVVLNSYGLFPLAGAVEEVKNLGNLFPAGRFKSFYGTTATKEHFFNHVHNFDLIHLALHAQSDHSNRFNNRIFFHPGNTEATDEQFICFAHELYNLTPPPRLVVLSACNTGAGTNYTGEGTYSTARGFIYAGTPSVVMSLWPLSDQASKVINGGFYKGILKGRPLDEALREAKLSFIESSDEWTAHPSRWAALNVVGSTMPVVKPGISSIYWIAGLLVALMPIALIFWWRKK